MHWPQGSVTDPIQNLPGLFGSRAEAGTSHEIDVTGRHSSRGWDSKSAAQMAPRCGHTHGVGGMVRATDPRHYSRVTMTLAISHPFTGLSRTLKLEPSPQDMSPRQGPSVADTLIHVCGHKTQREGNIEMWDGRMSSVGLSVYMFVHSPSFPST